ncbi:hypothetical protein TWF694_008639 [Orbilia ellipsospora]|uniref:Uncharacterized protein n=1 Tax=Orbilia ellipsospora TaxID=2528407 RepID=A0AAV9XI95_9PEZI
MKINGNTDPQNLETDISEDDTSASGYSSIFQASLYFGDEEGEKAKENARKGSFISDDLENKTTLDEVHRTPESAINGASDFSTSVDTCSTLVPSPSERTPFDTGNDVHHDNSNCHNVEAQDFMLYQSENLEPLCAYASPKEPSTAPPSMPGPQSQRRAETLAEMLFRQGTL